MLVLRFVIFFVILKEHHRKGNIFIVGLILFSYLSKISIPLGLILDIFNHKTNCITRNNHIFTQCQRVKCHNNKKFSDGNISKVISPLVYVIFSHKLVLVMLHWSVIIQYNSRLTILSLVPAVKL